MFHDATGEYLLYDKEEEGKITTFCSKVGLTILYAGLSRTPAGSHYRDLYYKNEVIKILKHLAVSNDDMQMERMHSLIQNIQDTSIYLKLLDDCFQHGIDLSNTYSMMLSMCSARIQNKETEANVTVLRQINYYSTVVKWFYQLLHTYHTRNMPVKEKLDLSECCELVQFQILYEKQFGSETAPSTSFSHHDLPLFIQCIQSVGCFSAVACSRTRIN